MTAPRIVLLSSNLFPNLAGFAPFFWIERRDSSESSVIFLGEDYLEARRAALDETDAHLLDLVANFCPEGGRS